MLGLCALLSNVDEVIEQKVYMIQTCLKWSIDFVIILLYYV